MPGVAMDTYIIAIRRDSRDKVPADWLTSLQGISGLTIVGSANPARVQVRATPEAIERVRQRCGDTCYIEPLLEHTTASEFARRVSP
jgi:hypothetical protein